MNGFKHLLVLEMVCHPPIFVNISKHLWIKTFEMVRYSPIFVNISKHLWKNTFEMVRYSPIFVNISKHLWINTFEMVRYSPAQVVPNTPGVWLDFIAWNLWSEDYHNFWSWSSRSSLSMEHCHCHCHFHCLYFCFKIIGMKMTTTMR